MIRYLYLSSLSGENTSVAAANVVVAKVAGAELVSGIPAAR
jgi:hypothetical protein